MKGMFSNVEGRLLRSRRAFLRKETDMSCEISWHFLFAWLAFLFHREHIFLSQNSQWPLPLPLPHREGRSMWGYPYWAACMGRGEVFLSRWIGLSLTERTEFTEFFGAQFEPTRRWPLPQPLPRREGRSMWGYPYKTAIKGHNEAYILFIGVSRWLRPSLLGRGRGRGRYLSDTCVFCSSVFSVRKNMSFSICHYVILS